jgi:signal transduction histidine kinase
LVEAHEKSNQWKDAFLYLSNLSQLVDSIHRENTKLDYLISEISKSKRIEKVLESKVSKNTVEINTLNLFLIWLASISIVCIVFLVFLFLAKRKKDQLYKKLDISNQNKDKIFRTLTHDIRTPLVDINNVLDLFQMDVITEDDRNTIVNTIRGKVEHLTLNVDSILQWSIGQIKGAKVKKEANNTRELILTAKEFVSNQSSLKNIEIDITEAMDDHIVNVDARQMHIILRNVFGNAIKFSTRGSKILVRTGQKSKYTYIEVEDFGKGMTDQEIKKILSEEQYTNDPSKLGVGVGLKLVKEYLAINNGELTIQSTFDKGSTFTIKIYK